MTVGEILLEYRRKNKKSLTQMAEMTGVTDRGWRKWELGKSVPAPEYLRVIADVTVMNYMHLMIATGHIKSMDVIEYFRVMHGQEEAV